MRAILRNAEGKERTSFVSEPAPVTILRNSDYWTSSYDSDLRGDVIYFVLDHVEKRELPHSSWHLPTTPPDYEPIAHYRQCSQFMAEGARNLEEVRVRSEYEKARTEMLVAQQVEAAAKFKQQVSSWDMRAVALQQASIAKSQPKSQPAQIAYGLPAPKVEPPKVEEPKSDIPAPVPFKRRMMKGIRDDQA